VGEASRLPRRSIVLVDSAGVRAFDVAACLPAGAAAGCLGETPALSTMRYGPGFDVRHKLPFGPIRADVALSMKVLTYNDLSMTHPGYWAFIAHQVIKEVYATAASIDNIANFGAVLGTGSDG